MQHSESFACCPLEDPTAGKRPQQHENKEGREDQKKKPYHQERKQGAKIHMLRLHNTAEQDTQEHTPQDAVREHFLTQVW